jgi:hypothetical protein
MTRRTSAPGDEHYLVRVALPSALLYFASWTEPKLLQTSTGRIVNVSADWINDPNLGDTLGYVNWGEVVGISWRYTGPGATPAALSNHNPED